MLWKKNEIFNSCSAQNTQHIFNFVALRSCFANNSYWAPLYSKRKFLENVTECHHEELFVLGSFIIRPHLFKPTSSCQG